MEMILNVGLTQWKKKKSQSTLADELDHLLMNQLMEIERLPILLKGVLSNQDINVENFKSSDAERIHKRKTLLEKYQSLQHQENQKNKTKTGSKKSLPKLNKKIPSYQITLALFQSGKDTSTIAQEREITQGTVEQHLLEALSKGEIVLRDWISAEEETIVHQAFKSLKKSTGLKELFQATGNQISYGRIRAILWTLDSNKNGMKHGDE
jgi:ATP-dependent DNA helicase RecQ